MPATRGRTGTNTPVKKSVGGIESEWIGEHQRREYSRWIGERQNAKGEQEVLRPADQSERASICAIVRLLLPLLLPMMMAIMMMNDEWH
jgi:hypothetical protein